MSIADLIRQMSALGAPSEAIALAVEAIEQAQGAAVDAQAKVEEKRAIERDRKRRQRERSRDSHGTVTGQSRDSPRTVTGLACRMEAGRDHRRFSQAHRALAAGRQKQPQRNPTRTGQVP